MKTILFLTVLLLASCEKQYLKQLHPYTATFTYENGLTGGTMIYKIVERNKDFLILKSDEWDTLFFDDKTHIHGVLNDWVSMQTHKSEFTGELTANYKKRMEINGVAMKQMGWGPQKFTVSIN